MNVAKILILPALFISLILPVTRCQEEIPQTVTSVMLDETFVTMIKGSTHRLSAVVLPEGIETSFEWTSTDTLVATVSQDGDVLAVEEGQCRIWARSGAFMAVCDVEVLKVPTESIVLNETSIEIMPGEQFQLTATINMQEVRSEDILEWSSSDMNVSVVDSAGMVTAMKTGEATVTAEFMGVTAECKVNVVDIPVSEIRLSSDRLSLFVGETSTIEAVILPINATDQEISWTSSDASVASVSAAGEVTALAAGEATITVECGGITEECSITVVMPDAKTGDYYYSDGTWSSELDGSKTPIAVVFYTGDPSVNDAAMQNEKPWCTHGLAVSLDLLENYGYAAWQTNYTEYGGEVGSWIMANTQYETTFVHPSEGNSSLLYHILGYNNTKGIEAFNYVPEHYDYLVDAVQYIADYRKQCPAPAASSDWYLPSVIELLYIGTNDIPDGSNIMNDVFPLNTIYTVNESIEKTGGLPVEISSRPYLSSMESVSGSMHVVLFASVTEKAGAFTSDKNVALHNIRPVLAF